MVSVTDGSGNMTSYAYDVLGNVTQITNPDGTTVFYDRDYINNTITVTDENGAQVKYTYNPLGLEFKTIDVQTGSVITRKEYDSTARLIKVSDFIYGAVTEYAYMGKTFTDVCNMAAKEIRWLIELAKSKYAESQTASKSATAVAAPAAPDPNDDKDQNSYYKKGLKNIPDNWIEVESEKHKVKSDSFKNFLKSQGYDPKGWIKVVEKWAAPDGTIYQRHYWTNGIEYFYHGNGIEVFIPH